MREQPVVSFRPRGDYLRPSLLFSVTSLLSTSGMVGQEKTIDAVELSELKAVFGRCHDKYFCVHLIQNDKEVTLTSEQVMCWERQFRYLNVLKPHRNSYNGNFRHVSWNLRNGWQLGKDDKIEIWGEIDSDRVFYTLSEYPYKGAYLPKAEVVFCKRTLRDLHKLFFEMFSSVGAFEKRKAVVHDI